jgi:hypothetical protein
MTDMATYRGYDFNKKQFYTWYSMPPKYSPTGQTYIIRQGDGGGGIRKSGSARFIWTTTTPAMSLKWSMKIFSRQP